MLGVCEENEENKKNDCQLTILRLKDRLWKPVEEPRLNRLR